jgi:DNA-directed RNA polymerase subunit H (RpoH/RPB5)
MRDVVMSTVCKMLGRRGYEVPSGLPVFEDFSVTSASPPRCCLVFFAEDSKAGVGEIRMIAKKMEELGASESVLICDSLTPAALTSLHSLISTQFICNMTPQSLMFDIYEHDSVPLHRIMKPDEIRSLCDKYGPVTNLPVIRLDDPMSKYTGARPGDVIEITRNRPNVGHHPYYRQVLQMNDM